MVLPLDTIPTPKSERWKYTNLPRALKKLDIKPATLGWNDNIALLKPDAPGAALYHDTALWDLNTAQAKDIKFVTTNETIDINAQDGQWLSPRLIVQVKDNEELTVIENHGGQGAYWKNTVIQISIGKNARLKHYRLFDESAEGVATLFTHVTLARDAHYKAFSFIEGAGTIRNQIHAEIQGENAYCGLGGVNLLKGAQHADTTITIEHQAPNCKSNQTYKSVLDSTSHCVFQGKVHVHQAAQKTDGYQLSNALILSPTAEMDTKPELEIYADDVKCSHGATTGKLDDAPLFYLRARGIPENLARALLIEAFCGQAVDGITDESMQETIREKIGQWLRSRA
jgi:Fe-S cluster assembly protein SufD